MENSEVGIFDGKSNLKDLICQFSTENDLLSKAMLEIYLIIDQLIRILRDIITDENEINSLLNFLRQYK